MGHNNRIKEIIIIPADGKDYMNIPTCINIAMAMGINGSLRVIEGKPAICIY